MERAPGASAGPKGSPGRGRKASRWGDDASSRVAARAGRRNRARGVVVTGASRRDRLRPGAVVERGPAIARPGGPVASGASARRRSPAAPPRRKGGTRRFRAEATARHRSSVRAGRTNDRARLAEVAGSGAGPREAEWRASPSRRTRPGAVGRPRDREGSARERLSCLLLDVVAERPSYRSGPIDARRSKAHVAHRPRFAASIRPDRRPRARAAPGSGSGRPDGRYVCATFGSGSGADRSHARTRRGRPVAGSGPGGAGPCPPG